MQHADIPSDNGTNKIGYASDEEFEKLLEYLKTKEGHKGALKTYYRHPLTEQQAKRLGKWFCCGTGEFWWDVKIY